MALIDRSTRDRTDIELLRAVGAFAVVCIHASAPGVVAGPAGGWPYYATALAIDSAATFAVPLFFAIAGWVLLVRRPIDTETDLWQRVGRVLRPLLVWSLIYLVWPLTRERAAVAGVVLGVPVTIHMWFLYAYVPLVLVVGMITLSLRQRSPRRPWLLLAVAFAAMAPSMLGLTETLVHARVPAHSHLQIYLWVLFYAFAGALLLSDRRSNELSRAWGGTLFIVGVVGGVCWARWDGFAIPLAAGSLVAATSCIGVLLLLRGVDLRGRARDLVRALGRASFGIYLAHVWVLTGLEWLVGRWTLFRTPTAHVVTLPIVILATFGLSAILVLGWSRDPRMHRWLG